MSFSQFLFSFLQVVAPSTIINGGPLFQEVIEEEKEKDQENKGDDKKKKKKKKKVKKSGGGEPLPALGVDVMRFFFLCSHFYYFSFPPDLDHCPSLHFLK